MPLADIALAPLLVSPLSPPSPCARGSVAVSAEPRGRRRALRRVRCSAAVASGGGGDAGELSRATLLWRAAKLPIYSVALVPLTVGAAAAYNHAGLFFARRYFGLLAATVLVITWLNLSNDVYDSDTGADKNKKEYVVNIVGRFGGLFWAFAEAGDVRFMVLVLCAILCGYVYQNNTGVLVPLLPRTTLETSVAGVVGGLWALAGLRQASAYVHVGHELALNVSKSPHLKDSPAGWGLITWSCACTCSTAMRDGAPRGDVALVNLLRVQAGAVLLREHPVAALPLLHPRLQPLRRDGRGRRRCRRRRRRHRDSRSLDGAGAVGAPRAPARRTSSYRRIRPGNGGNRPSPTYGCSCLAGRPPHDATAPPVTSPVLEMERLDKIR